MTMRLKPCPFCRGGAHIREIRSCDRILYSVSCNKVGCYGFEPVAFFPSPEEAAEEWNSREERTCRNELDGQYDEATFKCSECGYECEVSVPFAPAPYSGDTDWDCELPKHCPGCGAMVVGGNDG